MPPCLTSTEGSLIYSNRFDSHTQASSFKSRARIFFFFNDPAPTESSPLPLHDALPIWVPLGIGAAAAVRVGQALGRGDVAAASRSGWTATLLGAGFMCCAAVVLLTAQHMNPAPSSEIGRAHV